MKKELLSGILSADGRLTVGGVNVIAVLENTNGVFIINSIPHCPSDLQLCQQDSVEYYR